MHPILYILLFLVIAFVLGVVWFLADIKFAQKWSLKRAELGAQDRWRELNAHFEAGLKCRRPLLHLFQRFVTPGLLEADYALHLSNQGEHERALVWAQKASRKSATRPDIQVDVLPAEATVLMRLGRYADAQKVLQFGRDLLRRFPHSADSTPNRGNGILLMQGLIELNLGNLNSALQLGIEANAAAVSDPARALISGVFAAMGRFQEALDVLVYEPSRFENFLKPDDRELLAEDEVFAETADKMNEELSGVFGPAISLGRAAVFLETGDAASLGEAIEQTQTQLKSNQIMEHIFVRTRACWHAMRGDVAGVEADLARARQLTDEKPASRSAKFEYHLAAGRSRFLLGQGETAIYELENACRLALHPIEKHASTYWLARANQSANRSSAANLFKIVIANGFSTWMEADSRARSAEIEGP
jgi:tetratricopeptide (TPR) repeat protein